MCLPWSPLLFAIGGATLLSEAHEKELKLYFSQKIVVTVKK